MIIMGTVSLIGGITSYSWAPETNGRALTETSHRQDPHQYGRRRAALGEAG
jgi:putative MFS transporter